MRKVFASFCVALAAAVLGMGLLAGTASAKKGPKISSVHFSGTPASPTIRIKGVGLGSIPAGFAEPVPACYPEETATGNDFGNTVWLEDSTQGWKAGEGAGDCIGLIFSTYTETEVIFKFGSAYSHYTPVANGDTYSLQIYSLTKTGPVKGLKKH